MKIRLKKNKNGLRKNLELLKKVFDFRDCENGWIEIKGTTGEMYSILQGFNFAGFERIEFYY